ncbi:glycosyltransferase [Subtercola frigoramans]|uniref:Glycosyltransferase involved in cell wall biosynthesis n=1 Tax=Subtercola frigoramans TaxID=120298 RepID=A0ABS2L863_9MICO|nr:glycosyltransferase [Subtercola frigoramans]MBM7473282.1 glycosyltransferase involved in cell wall biosynthesis [Subtercola frigoramans]
MKPLYEQDPSSFVEEAETALLQRLRATAAVILPQSHDEDALALRGPGVLADHLARQVRASAKVDELWLLLTALAASFPDAELVNRARRDLSLADPALSLITLLDCISRSGRRLRALTQQLDIVQQQAVVDVDFCARYDHNTGIQRVVRETVSLWSSSHDIVLARWTENDEIFCATDEVERRRVLEWNRRDRVVPKRGSIHGAATDEATRLIVPFRTSVILPEVAREGVSGRLAALAEFSGNRVVMIGYDAIPFVTADLIQKVEIEKFARYSTVVKNSTRVAAISESAAEEFRGFVQAVNAQGVTGPTVSAVILPAQVPGAQTLSTPSAGPSDERSDTGERMVLIVGNQEPRKNLLAVLFAAETLWRQGLSFRLRMIGGARPDYKRLVDREVARLNRAGYSVELLRGVSDDVLTDSYRAAWFTIFPSLHEGYGLPVAESLAFGIPSITSDFGSTAEIAQGGGCLVVDPRDDSQIADAMRLLLTDDEAHRRLVDQARGREPRRWSDYADELWHELMEPLEAGSHD